MRVNARGGGMGPMGRVCMVIIIPQGIMAASWGLAHAAAAWHGLHGTASMHARVCVGPLNASMCWLGL